MLFSSCSSDYTNIVSFSKDLQETMLGIEFFNVADMKYIYNVKLFIWLRISDGYEKGPIKTCTLCVFG